MATKREQRLASAHICKRWLDYKSAQCE